MLSDQVGKEGDWVVGWVGGWLEGLLVGWSANIIFLRSENRSKLDIEDPGAGPSVVIENRSIDVRSQTP